MRGIQSAGNLVAQVEGDIEDVDGVMRITKIRLHYRFQVPAGTRVASQHWDEGFPFPLPGNRNPDRFRTVDLPYYEPDTPETPIVPSVHH